MILLFLSTQVLSKRLQELQYPVAGTLLIISAFSWSVRCGQNSSPSYFRSFNSPMCSCPIMTAGILDSITLAVTCHRLVRRSTVSLLSSGPTRTSSFISHVQAPVLSPSHSRRSSDKSYVFTGGASAAAFPLAVNPVPPPRRSLHICFGPLVPLCTGFFAGPSSPFYCKRGPIGLDFPWL